MKESVLPGSAAEPTTRRSFLKKGAVTAGAAAMTRYARDDDDESGSLTRGDAAILRFLQALETIEADVGRQYAERGGAGPATRGASAIDLPFAAWPTCMSPGWDSATATCPSKEGSRLSSPDP